VEEHREWSPLFAWRLTGSDRAAAEEVAHDPVAGTVPILSRFRGEARLETGFYRIFIRRPQRPVAAKLRTIAARRSDLQATAHPIT